MTRVHLTSAHNWGAGGEASLPGIGVSPNLSLFPTGWDVPSLA